MTEGGTRIEGWAHLADGTSVGEARVFFTGSPVPLPDIAALTDDDGRFSLFAPSPGRYQLVCHADGFDPASVTVDVGGDAGTVEVDIELS